MIFATLSCFLPFSHSICMGRARGGKGAEQAPPAAVATEEAAGPPAEAQEPQKPLEPTSPSSPAGTPAVKLVFMRFKTGASLRANIEDKDNSTVVAELSPDADCRDCQAVFGASGAIVAYASTEEVFVVSTADGSVVGRIPEPKVTDLQFSPSATYLVTHRPHDSHATEASGNLAVWKVADGTEVFRAVQAVWPALQWTPDEKFCVRQLNQRLMVHEGNLSTSEALSKVEFSFPKGKEASFEIGSSAAYPFIALFRPQTKTAQASTAVCRLPNVTEPLVSCNFGKGDSATTYWSKGGTACVVTVRVSSDSTNTSYYGTTTLWVINVKARSSLKINLSEGESVHDVAWSPTAEEFIVVHGKMPRNKATLYDANGTAVYSFGESPRNLIRWSPNGKMFVLGGTGGLAGEFTFYDRTAVGKRGPQAQPSGADGKLGFFDEKSTVQSWSPCSRYLLCANVFRLLRQDNKYFIYKHTGERVAEEKFPGELHGIDWVPHPASNWKDRAPSPTKSVEKVKQAYRAPGGGSSAAAALLARPSSSSIGGAVKPKQVGPVGGAVVEEKKKRKR